MSVIGSNILAGASGQGGGYNLTKSLRFRSSASARLTRTPASASNRKTYTISAWVKLGSNPSSNIGTIFCGGDSSTSSSTHAYFYLDQIRFYWGGAGGPEWRTTQVFRDYSGWYHLVFAVDTNQSTLDDKLKLYVNGVRVTSWVSQNSIGVIDTQINNNVGHGIGSNGAAAQYLYDGYMTEFNFIDGQQLTPSSFGETSTTTGVWIPKKYTGTYGTNGFYLPFTNTASTSTLGNDFSGNSNTWTVNNISLTSGSTYDSMTDVPTLTNATTANYAVLNPLRSYSANTISNANLNVLFTDAISSRTTFSTFGVTSGKWYFEMTVTATGGGYYPGLGVNTDLSFAPSGQSGDTASGYMYLSTGQKFSATLSAYGSSYTTNDVIGVALDMDGGTITFYKNNTSQGQAYSGITGTAVPCFIGNASSSCAVNFGQRPFAYTPPTGFVALNTFNLSTPTIGATASSLANKYFDATTYAGNNGTQSVTNSGSMQPDFVWVKNRTNAYTHLLYDSVRGVGTLKAISSSETTAEGGMSDNSTFGYLSALNSNGFTVVSGSTANSYTNSSSNNYIGWQWRASNTTAVTNTAGSITSTVSANTTAGFSIVTWTGNGTAGATVGHGLGVAPSMVIVKRRSAASNWSVSATAIGATKVLFLEQTAAAATDNGPFNSTLPSSTVITLGSSTDTNASGGTFVAYCFAQVAGYSAFGSYTGNGSSDGPFVFTGFRPKFLIVKRTNDIGSWIMTDSARSTYNVTGELFNANTSGAEFTTSDIKFDYLSNGFKLREVNGAINASGSTYIYMAFAESPFKYSLAR